MNPTQMKNNLVSLPCGKELEIKENVLLSDYASFRIGGMADLVLHPKSTTDLIESVKALKEAEYPFRVFGNASNLLFSDEGYRGAVIFTTAMQNCTVEEKRITADAGVSFTALAVKARNHALSGLEFAYGIPGTVGGAIYMNAGAYGGSVSDHLISSVCYDPKTNEVFEIVGTDAHAFAYRHSIYMENGCIILGGTFDLVSGDTDAIGAKMKEYMDSRRSKQPLEYPSAGSVFKRPEGYFAGKLIEDSELKGYSIGGAQVSEKHAGFIVNRGGATAEDVSNLIEHIQKEVYSRFGVHLETEIIRLKAED